MNHRASVLSVLLLSCVLWANVPRRLPSLSRALSARASSTSRSLSATPPPSALCDSADCARCARSCAPMRAVQQRLRHCDRALPLTAAVWPWDAYIQCVSDRCVPSFFEHACGLISADERDAGAQDAPLAERHARLLTLLSARLRHVRLDIQRLREQTHAYFATVRVNASMVQYHREALEHIQRCDALFVDALQLRSQYSKLLQYMQSVDYRIIQQEVKRLKFENEDFERHLHFWKRHNDTLQLVVQTSPQAIKHARDALYSEMRAYETDALLVKALRNGSYSKEKQARFTMRLREKVRRQLRQLKERNALVRREAQFLNEARSELYTLLRRVWADFSASRVNVTCGANVLSDAVTLAFKAESQLF